MLITPWRLPSAEWKTIPWSALVSGHNFAAGPGWRSAVSNQPSGAIVISPVLPEILAHLPIPREFAKWWPTAAEYLHVKPENEPHASASRAGRRRLQ
jgi:hypothetical protein